MSGREGDWAPRRGLPREAIYGIQPLREALESGASIEKIVLRQGLTGESIPQIISVARARGVPVQRVPAEWFRRFGNKNHQGAVTFLGVVRYDPLDELVSRVYERGEVPLWVVLDGITDVRNVGAIARSAECAGAHGLLLPQRGGAMINGDAVKSSAGALAHIPLSRSEDLVRSCDYLRESGLRLLVASEHGGQYYGQADLSGPAALVLGDEGHGVSPALLERADRILRIPVHGQVSSLNVSVAAGILLYAIEGQRHGIEGYS